MIPEFNRYSYVDPDHYEDSPVQTIPLSEQIKVAWHKFNVGDPISDEELYLLHDNFLQLKENPALQAIIEYRVIWQAITMDYLRLNDIVWRRKNPLR